VPLVAFRLEEGWRIFDMNAVISRNAPRIDHRVTQARQQWAYASGDYAAAGNALQWVAEELCESVKLCQDERVLDVAAGNYSASLAARARWCDVTTTDHASDLVHRSRERNEAASFGVRFVDGDPLGLPFADQSFDAVFVFVRLRCLPSKTNAPPQK
jgi:ubiquinone/menaquinone biosynthesis C-methylase UbiE